MSEDYSQEATLLSYNRGNTENRIWSKLIDIGLVQAAAFILLFISSSLAVIGIFFLWANADKMNKGQSPGKWLFGLEVINIRNGQNLSLYSSLIRNMPFCFLNIGMLFYSQWWAAIVIALSFLWIGMEAYFIFQVRTGIRIGDIHGGSRTQDYKDKHTRFLERNLQEKAPRYIDK